jgi:hypothetical protein
VLLRANFAEWNYIQLSYLACTMGHLDPIWRPHVVTDSGGGSVLPATWLYLLLASYASVEYTPCPQEVRAGRFSCAPSIVGCVAFLQAYISTGSGAQEMLTDAKVQVILMRMGFHLRSGSYSIALEQATVDIGLALAGAPMGGDPAVSGGFTALIFVSVVGFFVWLAWRGNKEQRDVRCAGRPAEAICHLLTAVPTALSGLRRPDDTLSPCGCMAAWRVALNPKP